MTVQQLINALKVIPGEYRDCSIHISVDGKDAEPDVVSLHVLARGDSPRAVALVRNRGGQPDGYPAPLMIVMPGLIVS